MNEETIFVCSVKELSCIIGNLFIELKPPCEANDDRCLIIQGITHSGKEGCLYIERDRYKFIGDKSDLEIVRNTRCPERKCNNGRL